MINPVDTIVGTATGAARKWIYATWVCHGYNPLDQVFWNMQNGNPPSDRAWQIVMPHIIKELGLTVPVPASLLYP